MAEMETIENGAKITAEAPKKKRKSKPKYSRPEPTEADRNTAIVETDAQFPGLEKFNESEMELLSQKLTQVRRKTAELDPKKREQNREIIMHVSRLMEVGFTTCNMDDPSEVQKRFFMLQAICAEDGFTATIEAFATVLGYSRDTIMAWCSGKRHGIPNESIETIRKIVGCLCTTLVTSANDNAVNPLMAIAQMRNNYGWTNDDKGNQITMLDDTERKQTAEEIAAKYANAPD